MASLRPLGCLEDFLLHLSSPQVAFAAHRCHLGSEAEPRGTLIITTNGIIKFFIPPQGSWETFSHGNELFWVGSQLL